MSFEGDHTSSRTVSKSTPPPLPPSSFEEPPVLSTPVGSPVMGLGGVIPLVGSRRKDPKALTILRYLKPEYTSFWTILY